MTPNEVTQTVLGLMNRTGAVQPSVVTMRDGTKIQAIPSGINMKTPGILEIVLQDLGSNTSRIVSPSDVASIQ